MTSWLKDILTSAPASKKHIAEEEAEPVAGLKACEVCGSTRRTTSASGSTLCAACWMSGAGQQQARATSSQANGRRGSGPSSRSSRFQGHGSLLEHDSESSGNLSHTASVPDLGSFGSAATPSSPSRGTPSTRVRRSAKKTPSPEAVKPGEDPLADLMRLPPPAAVSGRSSLPKSQSAVSVREAARLRPESYRDQMNRAKLLTLHQSAKTGQAAAANQSASEAVAAAVNGKAADDRGEVRSRHNRRTDARSDAEAMLHVQAELNAMAKQSAQVQVLPGGYRCGEVVQSLISRERDFVKVLEQGHTGMVVGPAPAPPDAQYQPCIAKRSGRPASGKREREDSMCRLLVQFKPGFDWLLAPHQICPPSFLASTLAAGLPGGFVWGERVRSLVECLSGDAKRGFCLGDMGTIIGPGHTPGKVAVRFDKQGGEWNIWPGTVCRAEAFSAAVEATLPGGLQRGDRVHTQATRSASASETSAAALALQLQDGEEGIVLGPGHADGRVLVRFNASGRSWSMMPKQLSLAAARPTSKVDKTSLEIGNDLLTGI